jgi:hypothetical protein
MTASDFEYILCMKRAYRGHFIIICEKQKGMFQIRKLGVINAMRNVMVVEKTISSTAKAAFWIEKSVSEEKRTRMTVTVDSYKGKWTVLSGFH